MPRMCFIKKILPFVLMTTLLACENVPKTIGIQPWGTVDANMCDTVKEVLQQTFSYKVILLKTKDIPKETFVNIKSPRYRADKLIEFLKEHKPDSINHVIGLLNEDISTTKKDKWGNVKKPEHKYQDWGIFGLGYRPGPSCVVSNYRFRNASKSVYYSRLKKISVHEIGHNLGLPHCENKQCVMQDAAESIKTIDHVNLELCVNCKSKL